MTKKSHPTLTSQTLNVSVKENQSLAFNLSRASSEFLAKKRKIILNKNKLSACLSS